MTPLTFINAVKYLNIWQINWDTFGKDILHHQNTDICVFESNVSTNTGLTAMKCGSGIIQLRKTYDNLSHHLTAN